MGKWEQVGGDRDWAGVGVVLAKDDKKYKSVSLVRIEPWMEHDSSAIKTHGLYVVDSTTVDYDEMGVDQKRVQSALQSTGLEEEEYKRLSPSHKAEVVASIHGYNESESTSNLLKALPASPGEIKFNHGRKETEESVERANEDMRREALDKVFDTSLKFGEMPEKKALEFAWGEGKRMFEINDDEKTGLGYAKVFSRLDDSGFHPQNSKWVIDDADDFKEIVNRLAKAPTGEKMGHSQLFEVKHYLGHPEDLGDDKEEEDERLKEMATEMAESAHALATNLMEHLGFSWR